MTQYHLLLVCAFVLVGIIAGVLVFVCIAIDRHCRYKRAKAQYDAAYANYRSMMKINGIDTDPDKM